MKLKTSTSAGLIALLLASGALRAEKPLSDYSFVRGVCYPGGWRNPQNILERDLGYAKRLNLNSTRVWLSYLDYEKRGPEFLDQVRNYIRTAHRMGISTMLILWNGNGLQPDTLKPEFRDRGDAYVKAVVTALQDEPGLLMWDVMNEPQTNSWYLKASPEDQPKREAVITEFLRHNIQYIKQLDPVNALTVGYEKSIWLEPTADLVDVLSFHEYTHTRASVEQSYRVAEETARRHGNKPRLNTETACIARSNPYDEGLQITSEHKTGFYLFELMVQGYWSAIHGIVYPDGTIRDPSIVAALFGFYRNRDVKTIVKPNPNREGQARDAIAAIEEALKEDTSVFNHANTPTDKLLEAAEYAANLLEAAEMVPMYELPTAKIAYWRSLPENQRDREAIRQFAYHLGLLLKKNCQIY
jgi:Cellulase (glycosyl hydrolase family 5)